MSDDKEKDKLIWYSTPWKASNYFYDKFAQEDKPVWIGIDWAVDSGMNRGDIIKQEGNVVYARFKAVELKPTS